MLPKAIPAQERVVNPPANDDALETAARVTKPAESAGKTPTSRKRLFATFGVVLAVGTLGYRSYWWAVGSHYVQTDNAYVDATSAQITPLVSAAITELRVKDTQHVRAGDILLTLDDAD